MNRSVKFRLVILTHFSWPKMEEFLQVVTILNANWQYHSRTAITFMSQLRFNISMMCKLYPVVLIHLLWHEAKDPYISGAMVSLGNIPLHLGSVAYQWVSNHAQLVNHISLQLINMEWFGSGAKTRKESLVLEITLLDKHHFLLLGFKTKISQMYN